MLSAYSVKWFTVYYLSLGLLGLYGGLYCFYQTQKIASYLLERTSPDTPPPRFRTFLRYFLAFTLPNLLLSFFPFSLIELAFSLWCLFMIYLAGSLLVRWDAIQPLISEQPISQIKQYIRITGAIMLSLGGFMFLLFYRIVQNLGK